jgi:hypothetical protein
MKTFQYPAQREEMNEYINSLPASTCTFYNEAGTVTVEEVKLEDVAPDAI